MNAAGLLKMSADQLAAKTHIVLPRGIPEPPSLNRIEVRERLRKNWNVQPDEIVVMNIGRISREKGAFELLESLALSVRQDRRIKCILVGALPAFDESKSVQQKVKYFDGLASRLTILPACEPETVWDYLCAADLFIFASHHEGMPNSLLEAMAMGLPAVAFGIPPVCELEGGQQALITVSPSDVKSLASAVLALANSPATRALIGERARARIREGFLVQNNMARALRELELIRGHFKQHSLRSA